MDFVVLICFSPNKMKEKKHQKVFVYLLAKRAEELKLCVSVSIYKN